ncbi:DNA polymerase III subunit gamma and tau [Herbiconiux sp. 11R-BC]|uniref:DNA polymerase III subunit gamma and tau n=1 Tax=Herbiconiux sp. 11R-BC TaxID=3111637 RepID=UPI003C2E8910
MIGQSQVTDPLMTALRTNRVNHAYLFSGPRGCGKTTSARILARCLNCAEGPTDTPCGVCPSCVELGRDGPGSLDVVEIDAASHNGVDDARDLRERAVFAPARDRFKIFILDEAHMVTPQGFNALLKIVEEPPEHIKFIFATTEPDKVIGTIRSRTHHYPFRLIPPAQLLEYVQHLCDVEGIDVAPGVLPLVVRAGGGSARDTLSILDQLIAGSENNHVDYERAVALLGYTHGALLSEAIDALGTHDGAAAFDAVDRVIQTGQDPRRFVEDLLERLRDIIVVSATREQASSVLRGVPADEIEVMRRQATLFGHAELSRVADIVNAALSEMTGATSPRLHLELMIARALVPDSDDSQRGALARVERLERRIGVDAPDAAAGAARAAAVGAWPVAAPPVATGQAAAAAPAAPAAPRASASTPGDGPVPDAPLTVSPAAAAPVSSPREAAPDAARPAPETTSVDPNRRTDAPAGSGTRGVPAQGGAASVAPAPGAPIAPAPEGAVPGGTASTPSPSRVAAAAGEVSLQQLKDAWPEILEVVQKAKMTAWLVVYTAQVRALDGDVLTLAFPSENDVASFKERSAPGQGVSEFLREAIVDVLGLRVKYIARVDTSLRPHDDRPAATPSASAGAGAGAMASAPVPAETPTAGTPATPARAASPASADALTDAGEPAEPDDDDFDPDEPDEEPPVEAELPPEPRAVVDPSGWAVPGLTENSPSLDAPAPRTPESDAAEVARMREQIASLTANNRPSGASQPTSPAASAPPANAPRIASSASRPAPDASAPVAGAPSTAPSAPRPVPDAVGSGASAPRTAPQASRPGPDARPQRPAPAPTTSWDVVAIPTSSDDDEPPAFDEPMPSDEPELPADRADAFPSVPASAPRASGPASAPPASGPVASAPAATGSVAAPGSGRTSAPAAPSAPAGRAPSSGGDPAARPGALRFESQPSSEPAGAPAASTPTAPSPAPTTGGRARYGEAVVREILGANFIEEQPLPGRD